jgi:hypothetical protein
MPKQHKVVEAGNHHDKNQPTPLSPWVTAANSAAWQATQAQIDQLAAILAAANFDPRQRNDLEYQLEAQYQALLSLSELAGVTWHDIPSDFLGGQAIHMDRDGLSHLTRVLRGGYRQLWQGHRPLAALGQLLLLLVQYDAASWDNPLRPGQPDEAHPELHLHLCNGETWMRWKWANDSHAGLDAVYALLAPLMQLQSNDVLVDR